MQTLIYVTELPSINKKIVEATRKERKAQKEYRAAQTATPPKPLGPPEDASTEVPSTTTPEAAPPESPTAGSTASARKSGVSYPDEVRNADGSVNYSPNETETGLSAPPDKGPSGWTGTAQDRADQAEKEKAGGKNPEGEPKPEQSKKEGQGLGLFTKAILGSIGYRVLGQVSSAMDATEKQRSEPQGYTGAGTR